MGRKKAQEQMIASWKNPHASSSSNMHGTFGSTKMGTAAAQRPHSASTHGDADLEVAKINAERSGGGEKMARGAAGGAARRVKTTQDYYPSSRRSKSMWNEGVEFTSPSPARFQLPSLPSINDLNSGMRDLEVRDRGSGEGVGNER